MIAYPSIPKRDLYKWLFENKMLLLTQKKSAMKFADAVLASPIGFDFSQGKELNAEKFEGSNTITENATVIKVRSIVNTTKIMDSHNDVHIDQLWNKSLKETKQHYLVKEHKFSFDGIISDDVKAFVKQIAWSELGYDYEGTTQALIYDSVISKSESPDMFNRYITGKVKQHSVGMRYVKVDLAVNDPRYEKEFALWEKYFDLIVNKEDAVEAGFFYPVTEAKNIEGSAVVRGSNYATPTQSITQVKDFTEVENLTEVNNEPPKGTQQKEPLNSTQTMELIEKYYSPLKHI